MSLPPSKPALRQQLRKARDAFVRALDGGERERLEAAAADRLISLLGAGVWASYIAIGSEISAAALGARARRDQPFAYPWFAGRDAPMAFRLAGTAGFTRGPFGIDQPYESGAEALPGWIVMPLVGVDAAGNRIGQGAGHYDRALAAMRQRGKIVTIGLAWDVQLTEMVPADPWDQPLDFIVTPSRTIETRK